MTVEDWEVCALYWRLVDEGASPEEAAEKVKQKFLGEICAPEKETLLLRRYGLEVAEVVGRDWGLLPEVRQVREPDRADRRTVHPIVSTRPPARLPVLSDHRPNRLPPGHSGS